MFRTSLMKYSGQTDSYSNEYYRLYRWILGTTKKAQIDIETIAQWVEGNPELLYAIAKTDKTLAKAVYFKLHGKFIKVVGSFHQGHQVEFDEEPPNFLK